jgi:adenosylhomocysteine nucleosidase
MVWQSVVRNWVRQAATEAIQQHMAAVGETARSASDSDPTQTPVNLDCDVGIVFALGSEEGGLEDLLSDRRVFRGEGFRVQLGTLDGRRVALVRSGMGRAKAARATEALIAGHHPRFVITSGFAGGLAPQVRRNEIVIATSIANAEGHRLTIDLRFADEDDSQAGGWHAGRLLTVDRVVRLPPDKAALGQTHAAIAVDMESLAVAEVCRAAKVPCLAIRVITDSVEDELPEFVENYAAQKTTAGQIGAAVGALFKKPASLKSMLALREEGLIASDRLARFLADVVRQLAPAAPTDPATHEAP